MNFLDIIFNGLILKNFAENDKANTDIVLNTILTYIPGHIYWQDTKGFILGCNEKQAVSLGYSLPEEVIGNHPNYLVPENEAKTLLDVLNKVISTGQPITLEESVTFKQGSVELLSFKAPLKNKEGQTNGMLGLSIDISKQKKYEKQLISEKIKAESANKAKSEFLENMRHDIRTPLTGIVGFSEIIKNEATDPKLKEYADHLIASSYALLDLLNGVLETINIDSGELPSVTKKFNLKEKLANIIALNQSKAKQKNLLLSFDYDDAIPKFLIGDPGRLCRVVLELITNALNFTHHGYVKLAVQLAKNKARIKQHGNSKKPALLRDENIISIRKIGKAAWKKETGYHRRSMAENMMFRFKKIFAGDLKAILFESQATEAFIKCNVLNTMTEIGMTESYAA